MNSVHILVSACITYGHLGYLKLKDQDLICLYDECLIISQYLEDISNVIQLYGILSELHEEMHCFEESSKYLNQMLKVSELEDNKRKALLAFFKMSMRYKLLCKRHKAIECCKKVINISKNLGVKTREGHTWAVLSDIYKDLERYQESRKCSENCIGIGKETKNKEMEGIGYFHLGATYLRLGKWNDAISCSEESIALQLNNKVFLGSAYLNIGLAYERLGRLDLAQIYLERNLEIAKEIGGRNVESTYVRLGDICRKLGKYEEALNCYQKGLSIAMDVGDKDHEGILLTNLGSLYSAQGNYHKSLQCLKKGLGLFKDTGNIMREGEVYRQIAAVYTYVGKNQESFEYYEKSLAIAIETGDKKGQMNGYGNLGIACRTLDKYEKSIEYYNKCIEFARQIGDKNAEGYTYINIGNIHLDLENPQEAIECFEMALEILMSVNDKEEEGKVYCGMGEAYFLMKQYREAITYFEKSHNIAKQIGNMAITGLASYKLGSVYNSLSKHFDEEGDEEKCQEAKQKSEEHLKEALQCWEWKFSHLKDLNDFKISIVDTFIHTYKLLTKVLIERQKTDEALLISDRGRARSLGDILVSRYGITQERATGQAPLDNADLQRVLSSNQFCILFFAMVDEDLYAWVLKHQKPMVLVNNNNQASTVVEAVEKFYLMKEMQAVRCENRSFESTDDSRLAKTRGKIPTQESLIQSVERNVDSVGEPQTNVTEKKTDPLEVLFSLLVTPVMQHLQHEEIVIIPDGPLYRVPFAALRDPTTGKYLSETKSIRISPSLTTLKALQECNVDHHSKTGALIVGDPDVGDVVLKGETTFLSRLPSAELEALEIGKLWDVKPLIGSQATKEMVKKKLREGVAVVHIAAHGDSEHGHIALAPPPRTHSTSIPEEQDYMLTMEEVQEIGVTAQLVVLSCCHSGRGEIKAEGVVGMSRAFLAAGARAVVASLRAIDDEAALSFMINFYEFLKMGESASKSLQKAMKELQEEGYEDPKYWAPFFLIGDDVTISG